jgi:quinol monooxygenase YgiN
MITRVVKLTLRENEQKNFLNIFEKVQDEIRKSEGCYEVQLLTDINNPNIFFTISKWENPDALEKYRKSALFSSVWKQVKELFATPAVAWSLRNR